MIYVAKCWNLYRHGITICHLDHPIRCCIWDRWRTKTRRPFSPRCSFAPRRVHAGWSGAQENLGHLVHMKPPCWSPSCFGSRPTTGLSWYIIMIYSHDLLSWYILMINYNDMLSWYICMVAGVYTSSFTMNYIELPLGNLVNIWWYMCSLPNCLMGFTNNIS